VLNDQFKVAGVQLEVNLNAFDVAMGKSTLPTPQYIASNDPAIFGPKISKASLSGTHD